MQQAFHGTNTSSQAQPKTNPTIGPMPKQPHYGTLELTLPNTPPTDPYSTKNCTCMTHN